MKQKPTELKGEINNSTIIVGAVNSPLSKMDRTLRRKIYKDIENLNKT